MGIVNSTKVWRYPSSQTPILRACSAGSQSISPCVCRSWCGRGNSLKVIGGAAKTTKRFGMNGLYPNLTLNLFTTQEDGLTQLASERRFLLNLFSPRATILRLCH